MVQCIQGRSHNSPWLSFHSMFRDYLFNSIIMFDSGSRMLPSRSRHNPAELQRSRQHLSYQLNPPRLQRRRQRNLPIFYRKLHIKDLKRRHLFNDKKHKPLTRKLLASSAIFILSALNSCLERLIKTCLRLGLEIKAEK